jgi:hypothetical protein
LRRKERRVNAREGTRARPRADKKSERVGDALGYDEGDRSM